MSDAMSDEPYANLARVLKADGIECYFQNRGQLVVSGQVGPAWPDRGNSFWVTHAGGKWHLFTWSPVGYLLPEPARMADLCKKFMAASDKAAYVVPPTIVAEFGLSQLSEPEEEAVHRAMSAEPDRP